MTTDILQAKQVLDKVIAKQRALMYKPIQVAEILYRVRCGELTVSQVEHDLDSYRNPSKRWRDSVSRLLVDRVCTSSQKFQDNLFEPNAVPPSVLAVLAQANVDGIVERYIYQKFREKQHRILRLGELLAEATTEIFDLEAFISEFEHGKGIKRSIGKAFETVTSQSD